MKLSDIRGEKAIEMLADLMEPVAEIMADKEVVVQIRGGQKIKGIAAALRGHKKACLTILALTEGENPETYSPNIFAIPKKGLELLNDPELMSLFTSQSQEGKTSSGSAMENTEAGEA